MLSPVLTTMLAGFATLLHPDGGQDQASGSPGEASRDAPAARLAEEVRRSRMARLLGAIRAWGLGSFRVPARRVGSAQPHPHAGIE